MPLRKASSFPLTNKMLGKKMGSVKNLAKMAKIWGGPEPSQSEWLLGDYEKPTDVSSTDETSGGSSPSNKTPTGFFTIYIGEERRRFVVPMGYLSHPLFKMMLEKSSEEFGFGQKNGLVVPCSVGVFQEVVSVVESSNGKCDLSGLVKEFI